jgi:glycosyltransferase involved in cell wall biosynthesis
LETAREVSIVIPVYNGADYLREAVDSALGQTYPRTEVIVVNDGSTDEGRTDAIARSYGARIRYFTKANGGVSTALNLGIREMTGEWFVWLSHDDLFHPRRIEQVMAASAGEPEVRVFFSRVVFIDERGRTLLEAPMPLERVTNPREALQLGGVDMCSMTIHRSCFEVAGLFNESNRTTQDVEMSLRLSRAFPFVLCRAAVTYKRVHPSQGTATMADRVRKDVGIFVDVIHDELSLSSFFPSLPDTPAARSEAWIWMGDLYRSFGARHYAQEAYDNAREADPHPTPWRRVRIRARKLGHPAVNKMMSVAERLLGTLPRRPPPRLGPKR